MSPQKTNVPFVWHCRRIGGTDQVTLSTMAELRRLGELDPKFWGALSCPTSGLSFDARTLELLDSDHDGRIRVPEVLEAVEWLCARLKDTADITGRPESMPLAAIDVSTEVGQRLLDTARDALVIVGRPDDEELTQKDVAEVAATAAERPFNGDGVLPSLPDLDDEPHIRAFIEAGLAIVGGARDASGVAGLNIELADALTAELGLWKEWRAQVGAAPHPVAGTEEAWDLMQELRPRIDDFFLRCSLAAFAPQADGTLNAEETLNQAIDPALHPEIDAQGLAVLPLARVAPDAVLPLVSGLNPIWRDKVQRFAELVQPLLDKKDGLTLSDWRSLQEDFAPFGAALALRPKVGTYEAGAFAPPENPAAAIEALGEEKIDRLLDEEVLERFKSLCAQDLAGASAAENIADLERLVLYSLHLHRFLMSFVSFHDFYSMAPNLLFRAGMLFLDGRSCRLCVPADDIEAHSRLASRSGICLLYCNCVREGGERRGIMAALTAGSDDVLTEGRNGIFVDNEGRDWDATLVKIVHNPISFRQAIWAPYKRMGQIAGEQLAKFAAAKNSAVISAAEKTASAPLTTSAATASGGTASNTAQAAPAQPAPAAAQPFDMGKTVGIFAAVGIALGAIGTAVGSIAQALFSLSWWQFPLLILGIFLLISGPSMFLAWLKFRKRTLGPILEASGWAVNSLLPVNLKMGAVLTGLAETPENLERQPLLDPFRTEKKRHGCLWFFLLLLAIVGAGGGWLRQQGALANVPYVTPWLNTHLPAVAALLKPGAPKTAGADKTEPVRLEPTAKVKGNGKARPGDKPTPAKPGAPPAPPKDPAKETPPTPPPAQPAVPLVPPAADAPKNGSGGNGQNVAPPLVAPQTGTQPATATREEPPKAPVQEAQPPETRQDERADPPQEVKREERRDSPRARKRQDDRRKKAAREKRGKKREARKRPRPRRAAASDE